MLKQKTALYFLLNIFNAILGLVTISIVARYMGPEPLGIIASILAFISLFNIFGDFGFGLAHYKRVSEGKDLGKCIGTYASVNIVLSVLIIIVILSAFLLGKYFFDKPYITQENESVFYVLLVSTFIGNILKIISVTFAARLEVAKEVIISFTKKLALSVAKIIVALLGLSVLFLAAANLFSVIIAASISIFFFWKYPISLPSKEMFFSYAKFALPVALMGVTELYINLDKVFISQFAGVKEVAYYTAAFGIVNFFYFFGNVFINILLPTFSKMDAKGDNHAIANLSAKAERYLSLLLSPMIIFIAIFSVPITLIILGDKFDASASIMSVLVINVLIVILSRPYSVQAIGTNRVKLALFIQVFIGVLNILLNIILIPKQLFGITLFGLGANGAAIALLIANFLGMSFYRFKAFRNSGKGINIKIFIHIVFAIIIFGLGFYFTNGLFTFSIISILLIAVLGELIYLFALFMVGELNKGDLIFLLDFINVKKMKGYIVGEVKNKDIDK